MVFYFNQILLTAEYALASLRYRVYSKRGNLCFPSAHCKVIFGDDSQFDAGSEVEEDTEDLRKSFTALQAELQRVFGDDGPLPKLSTLQQMQRSDLEQASISKARSRLVHPTSWNKPLKLAGTLTLICI